MGAFALIGGFSAGTHAAAIGPTFAEDQVAHRRAFTNNNRGEDGVKFSCAEPRLRVIEQEMVTYLGELGIAPAQFHHGLAPNSKSLRFVLTTPADDVATLDLRFRPEMEIRDQLVELPSTNKKPTTVLTVSKKEIVLSLLQHGRLTEFAGDQCSFEAFQDQVGIRQNIVAWAERLEWKWPNGKRAQWNARYWRKGTPLPGVSVSAAVADAFLNQEKYSIGCYTASKLLMVHGILDYYGRIKRSPADVARIERRLLAGDNDPLVRIEPRAAWAFESDFDPAELWQEGKLLGIRYNIPARNFVPGDWGYLLNPDPVSYQKTGYEGSNAIYLGRGHFADYYNDHAYSFREKLDTVYQWRNQVFSRSRDIAKVKPLTENELKKLEAHPAKGGLVMDIRMFYNIPHVPHSASID